MPPAILMFMQENIVNMSEEEEEEEVFIQMKDE